MMCPRCGRTVDDGGGHGPWDPRPDCKWGWETEMDGSPLQPPVSAAPEPLMGTCDCGDGYTPHKKRTCRMPETWKPIKPATPPPAVAEAIARLRAYSSKGCSIEREVEIVCDAAASREAQIAEADSYVAWLTHKENGPYRVCDSDTKGAFKVYRQPSIREALSADEVRKLVAKWRGMIVNVKTGYWKDKPTEKTKVYAECADELEAQLGGSK